MANYKRSSFPSKRVEGVFFVLNIESGKMIELSGVGESIWLILKDKKSFNEIIKTITREYDVSLRRCRNDIDEFLKSAISTGIVVKID